MAGQPKKRAMISTIKAVGGVDRILDAVASGVTLTEIARTIGVDRSRLSTWLNRDPDTAQRLAHARKTSAAALVEQGLEIVDRAEAHEANIAKLKSDYRRWMASKLDREQWGDDSKPTVAIQINTLHADLLRRRDE